MAAVGGPVVRAFQAGHRTWRHCRRCSRV